VNITAVGNKMVKLERTDRFSDAGCDIRSDESRYRCNTVAEAHKRAGVLWRNVYVIDVVTGAVEAAHGNSEYEQYDGQCCLSTVHVTQSNQKHTGAKHTCNQPTKNCTAENVDGLYTHLRINVIKLF